MKIMAMARLQEIIIGVADKSKEIGKLEKQGLVRKIAPRLYTSNLEEAPEKVVRRNWYRLVSEHGGTGTDWCPSFFPGRF